MATLYEIDRAVEDVLERGFSVDEETGEVLFEAEDLDALGAALGDKLEACGLWLKNQRALAESIKAEEKALAERRRAAEKRVERMSAYMLRSLEKLDGCRLETARVQLSARRSTRVVVDSEEDLPPEFVQVVESFKVDKAAVGRALKAGARVPGAHAEERLNLQVK